MTEVLHIYCSNQSDWVKIAVSKVLNNFSINQPSRMLVIESWLQPDTAFFWMLYVTNSDSFIHDVHKDGRRETLGNFTGGCAWFLGRWWYFLNPLDILMSKKISFVSILQYFVILYFYWLLIDDTTDFHKSERGKHFWLFLPHCKYQKNVQGQLMTIIFFVFLFFIYIWRKREENSAYNKISIAKYNANSN